MRTLLEDGRVANVPTTGVTWREPDGTIIACPITSILATKSVPRRPWERRRLPLHSSLHQPQERWGWERAAGRL